MKLTRAVIGAVLACAAGTALAQSLTPEQIRAAVGRVDGDYIRQNTATGRDWPSYGLNHAENRFSPLRAVNVDTVSQLGLAWSYDLGSKRGVQATPVVVGGVMYVTASWSVVHALNARTGERIWTFDPEVPREYGEKGCCDVVNRGVAVHRGKVYVASYDGRLFALDAATGAKVWEKDTIIDRSRPYTISGAVRVFKNKVVIGNGGAEYGVRGYLTAYDAETGAQAWRWFSVPGNPANPPEDESMARAMKTWDPAGKWWEAGGGGTMWDTLTYDAELDLIYVGTGNGSPWNRNLRSPAGGDNLYLHSIVALKPDTGQYVWHYQHAPGETWDYTAVQPMILADLTIDGQPRKVILHAPKNGFFYVIDRTDGRLISAKAHTEVNWATGYDNEGRPIENPAARDPTKTFEAIPTAYGARNWHPMSFNPQTGLVYMPVHGVPLSLTPDVNWQRNATRPGAFQSASGWNLGYLLNAEPPKAKPFGRLVAWDPIRQEAAWAQDLGGPWNGGTLTTAGNLVFQGTADARFVAYDARDGKKLWEVPVGSGVVAAPATYEIDGQQYVSVAVGWGGVYGIVQRASERVSPGRVYTFRVGGQAAMPAAVTAERRPLVSGIAYAKADVEAGTGLYVSHCAGCHGVPGVNSGGNVPNLGYARRETLEALPQLVLGGAFADQGMPRFHERLNEAQVLQIRAFILDTVEGVRPR
ncbi:PQQ-dependent dehydrogenase, methanol/ethanol family [Paracraurococcus ruber]|uniref:PQQ-dependent dehydrogenase, methanol/ethanol family n=1 Tax=Paracraurococcus ruber TaxID=77675 RepID=A0ABS1CXY7_9PROT|nr:PQQ-dependent dehydrogenase, methanol/ethanol family [Paracraurococcus ruber]MBK1659076.1 PQQ-dependent dehydrogenase, methanol/ethanol family [Paracraurococcus ruber]TDG32271.1 PQQ-dependent dehydrogenase, methanol/ethanol family [Paracraurococcus ruber]